MSEVDKIILTTLATIFGGVAVFVLGQLATKFLIEPIYEQRKVVGSIADALIYFAHHFADSVARPFDETRDASDRFRRLASELMARTVAIPGYRSFGWLRAVRPYHEVVTARGALIGLSNTLHRSASTEASRRLFPVHEGHSRQGSRETARRAIGS